MRVALLGDHPDGVGLAGALIEAGHPLDLCAGLIDDDAWQRLGRPRRVSDVEEALADPAIELVIVAGPPAYRAAQLRRAIQSERHVACVHPADDKVDTAYEAALMAGDTGYTLFPVLPEGLHPAIRRLGDFIDRHSSSPSPVGRFRLLLVERAETGAVLENAAQEGMSPSVPGWDVLRELGGELAEVSSFADEEELEPFRPVLLAGRFERGGLFQLTLVPGQPSAQWRLAVIGDAGRAELTFPQGWNGPAILEWRDAEGRRQEEYFERWDAWPAVAEQVIRTVAYSSDVRLTWQDEVRCLELDDAARGSVQKRRANLMEYQDATEEVGFKGTMTLLGCGVLWALLILLVLSSRYPWVGWLALPILLLFIALQFLRYAIPAKTSPASPLRSGEGESPE